MESLYRKYRPLTFDDVVGQQHIVSTLTHAVTEGRLSHAYLFCGPRGTGKTTMARILAKSLLCVRASGQVRGPGFTGAAGCLPDGSCAECRAIAEGTHPDVYELDAASRTGVDNVREEIINSVGFAPVRGAYKVYIIDEVHMLTTAAFNALLKTLEEPPAHVVFVLCTTDPQKLPETILSRCQRFDFRRIASEDIVARMRSICEQEGFAFDDEALDIVARHARGGMRDALSTLEQLSVFGDGAVRASDARSLLGEASGAVLARFSRGIAERDVAGLFQLVREQVDAGNDTMELTRDLVAHMRDVYTVAVAGPRQELFDGTPEEVRACAEEARLFESADRLARTLTVLDDAALEMRTASDPRLVLEIALTRLARPESDLTLEALSERLDRLEAQLAAGAFPVGAGAAGAAAAGPAPAAAPIGSGAPAAVRTAPAPAPIAGASQAVPADASQSAAPAPAGSGRAPEPAASVSVSEVRADPVGVQAGSGIPSGRSTGPVRAAGAAAPAAERSTGAEVGVASVQARPAAVARDGGSQQGPRPARPQGQSTAQPVRPLPAAPDPRSPEAAALQRKWSEVIERTKRAQPSRGVLIQNSRAVADDGSQLVIWLKASDFAFKMLARPDAVQVIQPIVEDVFGPRELRYTSDEGCLTGASRPTAAAAPAPVPEPVSRAAESPAGTVSAGARAAAGSPGPVSGPRTAAAPAPQASRAPAAAGRSAPARSGAGDAPRGDADPVTPMSQTSKPMASERGSQAASVAVEAPAHAARAAAAPSSASAAGRSAAAPAPGAPAPAPLPASAGPESAAAAAAPASRGARAGADTVRREPGPVQGPGAVPMARSSEQPAQQLRQAAQPPQSASASPGSEAWADDVVPYDDASAVVYGEDDLPPWDPPEESDRFGAPTSAQAPAAPAPAPAGRSAARARRPAPGGGSDSQGGRGTRRSASMDPAASARAAEPRTAQAAAPAPGGGPAESDVLAPAAPPATVPAPAPARPSVAAKPSASDPASADVGTPQSAEAARELLTSVFGAGVVFKED